MEGPGGISKAKQESVSQKSCLQKRVIFCPHTVPLRKDHCSRKTSVGVAFDPLTPLNEAEVFKKTISMSKHMFIQICFLCLFEILLILF